MESSELERHWRVSLSYTSNMKARKKRQCIVVNVVNKDRKMKEKREAKEIDKAIEDMLCQTRD